MQQPQTLREIAAQLIREAQTRPASPDQKKALDAAHEARLWAPKNTSRARDALAVARAALNRC